jgi:hypothetical protein
MITTYVNRKGAGKGELSYRILNLNKLSVTQNCNEVFFIREHNK